MTVNRQRIIGSEAERREDLGGLPWLVSEVQRPKRPVCWRCHLVAALLGAALAACVLAMGL